MKVEILTPRAKVRGVEPGSQGWRAASSQMGGRPKSPAARGRGRAVPGLEALDPRGRLRGREIHAAHDLGPGGRCRERHAGAAAHEMGGAATGLRWRHAHLFALLGAHFSSFVCDTGAEHFKTGWGS